MGADNETSDPCLFFRDGAGRQQISILPSVAARLTIGRGPGSDLHLPWDNEVSRLHAQLEHVGSDWILVDDGLSSNGTYVNGERLIARHRLRDGDVILVGSTTLSFRADRIPPSPETGDRPKRGHFAGPDADPTASHTGAVPPLQGWRALRDAGDEPADRGRNLPQRRQCQESPTNAVRKVRRGGSPAEPKRARLVELAFTSGLVSERNG